MKTKNIFKALALAILMPALLLNTACNSEIINNENTDGKGFALPVTVNVSRQGDDPATKATYTDNGDGTGSLGFSEGDILFVSGDYDGYKTFAGTLTWQSGGTFSGTIYTQEEWTGTADELFTAADYKLATLLPNGYESIGFLAINDKGTSEKYDDYISISRAKAFVASETAKATGVEQLSWEDASSYSSSFALAPRYAILNFTISGLAAGAQNVTLKVTDGNAYSVTGSVTPNASGVATFAIGVPNYTNIQNVANNLTVGTANFTLPSNIDFYKGKIYNIARSAAPAPTATSLSELKTAINGGTDCSSYIGWEVNSAGAIAESGISGTKIGYVAYVSTSDVDAGVSGSRILVIASADAAATALTWGSDGTYRHLEAVEDANDLNGYSNTNTLQGFGSEAHPAAYAAWNYSATIPSGGASPAHWFMPTKKQWENMRDAKGGAYSAMATAYGIDGNYWTSNEYFNGTDYSECNNYAWRFAPNSTIMSYRKLFDIKVRSIFAY